jgi:hypothetical protein
MWILRSLISVIRDLLFLSVIFVPMFLGPYIISEMDEYIIVARSKINHFYYYNIRDFFE